ncbi:MAG TPA: ABC transporter ATP-binding protein [Gemmataceae bacterium]|nr:ABC transporter ATP-binding protein [Gemmataceae bacterium]
MPCIELDHVSMIFRVREQYQITLKEYVLKGMFRRSANPVMEVRALRDVSLRFQDGDRVGIIGGNGAGKSTLLRLLAGIYHPTRGCRTVQGRISSLFELSLGFEMEASGRQNILYRGYLQGETPRSMRAKMQEIADFCELGRYLDIPVRFYSAGMQVRLAFSIATTIKPEILLVDEVLSAGDMAFQAKARQRMREMMSRAKIMVVVSHDLETLAAVCDTGVWLHQGRVCMVGPMHAVSTAYKEYAQRPAPAESADVDDVMGAVEELVGTGFPPLQALAVGQEL